MTFIINQAVTGFSFGLVDKTNGNDITTGTPVGRVTIDGGTQAAIGDTTPTHEGNGQWTVDLTAAEMNGIIISLVFTHASAVTVHFTIKTQVNMFLEQLFAVDYDPTSIPGVAGAYLNELVESDTGSPALVRYTKKALEQSPSSGGGGKESGNWKFSTVTTAADPGTGRIRVNNSTLANVTQIYIHEITDNGGQSAFAIEALAVGDTILVYETASAGNLLQVTLNALPTDNGTWYTLPVTFVSGTGSLTNNRVMTVELRYVGVTTDQIADAVWRFVLSGITAAGSGSKIISDMKAETLAILADTADMQPKLGAPVGASISVDIAQIKAETAVIVADTNELQTDDIPGKISALNNIAATEIVSAGAINTLSGAVINVDLVDVCTTNSDMRGNDTAPDNASITLILADTNELQTDDIPGLINGLENIAATDIVSAGSITTLSGAVVNVDTVDVCAVNTDMRGTNSAALASVATEARLAELDPANLPANIDNILTDTGTTLDGKLNAIQGGGFNGTTDSLEAIRDRGDSAWITGGGGGGSDRFLMIDTTIATLASQTSFTLTAGSGDDGAYDNCTIVVEDVATVAQKARGVVTGYIGGTKTVTLKEPMAFNIAATDKVYILAENSLKSTVANRQLDITANGNAGIDWGNIENKTTANDLSATDIQLCDTTSVNTDMVPAPNNASIALILEDTANMQPKLGSPAGADISIDIKAIKDETVLIVADTNELQVDWVDGGRLDVLMDRLISQIDTAITEPGTGLPPVSAKMADKIGYLYKSLINKADQTNALTQLYNNDGTTVGQKRTVSSSTSLAVKEPLISG